MKVLIDTNVIIDVLTRRNPHFDDSFAVLSLCGNKLTGYVSASQTTDIFYLLRRGGLDAYAAKNLMKKLSQTLKILDVKSMDVTHALLSPITDYEDALLACTAERQKLNYIITRNEKDFKQSAVQAVSPSLFLSMKN
jgi:predicted nucleic acid-binding protein